MTGATDGLGAEVRVSTDQLKACLSGLSHVSDHDGASVLLKAARDLVDARATIADLTRQLAAERTRADEAERERDEALNEAELAHSELSETKNFDWPKWASECLDIVRNCSGKDSIDDADGVDLPEELEELLSEWDDYEAKFRAAEAARAAAEAALAEAERTIAAMKENLDPCPFSRKDCRLEPEDACIVCGDLGTWDDANMDCPSRCVTRGQVRAARLTAQAGETEGGAT